MSEGNTKRGQHQRATPKGNTKRSGAVRVAVFVALPLLVALLVLDRKSVV